MRYSVLAAVAAIILAAPVGAVAGTYLGQNGRIAVQYAGDIWTINPDGTGAKNVTRSRGTAEAQPSISPSGTKIAYSSETIGDFGIYTERIGGSKKRKVVTRKGGGHDPTWSRNGKRLAFFCHLGSRISPELCRIDADGDNFKRLTRCGCVSNQKDIEWSRQNRIVFRSLGGGGVGRGIFTIGPNGGTPAPVIAEPDEEYSIASGMNWSPDGNRLIYESQPGDLASRNASGTDRQQIYTASPAQGLFDPYYSPDGRLIVALNSDNQVVILDPASGQVALLISSGPNYDPDWGPAR